MRYASLAVIALGLAAANSGCDGGSASAGGPAVVTQDSFTDFASVGPVIPVAGGRYVMRGMPAAGGDNIYMTDLTPEGTELLMANASLIQDTYGDYAVWNGRALFMATDSEGEQSVWMTDGTVDGTDWVADIDLGPGFYSQNYIRLDGNRLILTGTAGSPAAASIIVVDL